MVVDFVVDLLVDFVVEAGVDVVCSVEVDLEVTGVVEDTSVDVVCPVQAFHEDVINGKRPWLQNSPVKSSKSSDLQAIPANPAALAS